MAILKIYNSYYKHIPLGVFNAAVESDPTSYNQGKIVKVGNFVKWILKLYSNNSWKSGDSYETMDLLSKFIKYKSKLPIEKRDINKYNSVSELYSLIQTLEGQGVKTQSDVKREGAEVVYEDSEWKIVIPHTEASCIYGANTRWCTAGRENNMFDYYNKQGLLYININKVTGDKYQFHFECSSFMDAEDKKISLKNIGLSEGVIEYYKTIGKEPYFIYDYVWRFYNGFAKVKLDEKGYNFINPQGELLWKEDKWFDNTWVFSEGVACVKLYDKFNFINTNGELVWGEYKFFNNIGDFHNGFARVEIEGKGWNLINTQGELLWSEYKNYDKFGEFSEGFAWVEIKDRGWNLINTQGELVWKEYKNFVWVSYFHEGFAVVYKEGKGCNFIKPNGELLWKEDICFDNVYSFYHGYGIVYKKGRGWNFINKQGELLWKGNEWFSNIVSFDNGFAKVEYKGKWNRLNSKGELVN